MTFSEKCLLKDNKKDYFLIVFPFFCTQQQCLQNICNKNQDSGVHHTLAKLMHRN